MITVAGEALYDIFPRSLQSQGPNTTLDAVCGGSPFNVACGLGKLGHAAKFFGGIALGELGDKQFRMLEEAGVETDVVVRKSNLVPLMVIELAADGQPAYNYYGQSTADVSITEADLSVLESQPEILHLGSYSLVLPPISETLSTLVESLDQTSLLSIDPNVRPMVEAAPEIWRQKLAPLYRRADIIKLSDEDAAFLSPDETPELYAQTLGTLSGAPVFLTKGSSGVSVFLGQEQRDLPAPTTEVADTVGAGDSFQATLLAWSSAGERRSQIRERTIDFAECCAIAETAIAVAAHICTRKGATMPSAEELETAISPELFRRIGKG